MRKAFKAVLPDEPYKTTTKLNRTIDCVYTGPRYLLIRVVKATGAVFAWDEGEETLEALDKWKIAQENLDPEGHIQVVLDADQNPFLAAYITHEYEQSPVPNYVETLPTGEKYEYHYDDEHGVCAQPFYTNDAKWDSTTNSWVMPRYRNHAITRASFFESQRSQLRTFEEAASSGNYLPEQIEKIEQHAEFLRTIETKYAGVDHWKIPYPQQPAL